MTTPTELLRELIAQVEGPNGERGPLADADAMNWLVDFSARAKAVLAAAPKKRHPCDAGRFSGNTAEHCTHDATFECICARCTSEPEETETFYSCPHHLVEVYESHRHIRGKAATWSPL